MLYNEKKYFLNVYTISKIVFFIKKLNSGINFFFFAISSWGLGNLKQIYYMVVIYALWAIKKKLNLILVQNHCLLIYVIIRIKEIKVWIKNLIQGSILVVVLKILFKIIALLHIHILSKKD